jgi:tripartite-type tricarboxylate transporter receptor subunit TctC
MTTRRTFLAAASGLIAGPGISPTALAQTFPSKSIEFIVPFPAGGSADILARLVGQHMTQQWGQPVTVLDKPGGGTVIGTGLAARAPPDGYTIVFISNSFVINAKLRSNLPYDGIKAFAPVALMVNSPQVIAVHAASPYSTFKEWIAAARARPESLSLGTLGPATTQHIAAELLQRTTGVRFIYVPFTGSNLAVNAALGGHLDAVLGNYADMAGHLEAGKLRPLAVTTVERLDRLKSVPTVAESGYPGYEAVAWFGVAAPVGTPPSILEKLSAEIAAAVSDPESLKRFEILGLQPAYLAPSAFAAHIATQYARYARVIDDAQMKAD